MNQSHQGEPIRSAHNRMYARGPLSDQEKRANRDLAAEANIRTRKTEKRGAMNRGIVAERTSGGVERGYHVTKGWRSRRVPLGNAVLILPEPAAAHVKVVRPVRPIKRDGECARRTRQIAAGRLTAANGLGA